MKKIIFIAIIALIIIGSVAWYLYQGISEAPAPEEQAEEQEIIVTSPQPNAIVESPLAIEGQARGTWYFEASFPIRLLDEDGKEIGLAIAQAQGDWMTSEFVPFEAQMEFEDPSSSRGILIFEKDNPSGLPENANEFQVPVAFSKLPKASKKDCVVTGCSNQICADQEVATTCEYREEYACYKTATCERQDNGECGWTETPELEACLSSGL